MLLSIVSDGGLGEGSKQSTASYQIHGVPHLPISTQPVFARSRYKQARSTMLGVA